MRKLVFFEFSIVTHFFLMFTAQVSAAPVIGPNGNAYEYVEVPAITWDAANIGSSGSEYLGVSGHLVTISSATENNFVLSLLSAVEGSVWLGGTDTDVEGEWKWVTGEQFWQGDQSGTVGPDLFYANWLPGIEPNDCCQGEDYLTMFGQLVTSTPGVSSPGNWNDLFGGATVPADQDFYIHGYVIEYEISSIPLPASVYLFSSGVLLLMGFLPRRATG